MLGSSLERYICEVPVWSLIYVRSTLYVYTDQGTIIHWEIALYYVLIRIVLYYVLIQTCIILGIIHTYIYVCILVCELIYVLIYILTYK